MTVFVDTSALLAVLDADDAHHDRARELWTRLLQDEESLTTSNYVLVESFALARNRLGTQALRALAEDVIPVLRVLWMDPELHAQATAAVLAAGRRKLSLVDCSSFVLMRRHGIQRAFAFDRHFTEQGFDGA